MKRKSLITFLRERGRLWLIPLFLVALVLAGLVFVIEIGFVVPVVFE